MEKKNNIIIGLLIIIIALLLCLLGYLIYEKISDSNKQQNNAQGKLIEPNNLVVKGTVKEFDSKIQHMYPNYIKKLYMLENGETYIEFYKKSEIDTEFFEYGDNYEDDQIEQIIKEYTFNFNGVNQTIYGYKFDSDVVFKDGYVLQYSDGGFYDSFLIDNKGQLYSFYIYGDGFDYLKNEIILTKVPGFTDVVKLVVRTMPADTNNPDSYEYNALFAIDSKGNELEIKK